MRIESRRQLYHLLGLEIELGGEGRPLAPRPDRFDDLVDGTKWQRLASTGPGAYARMRRAVHAACPASRLAVQSLQVFHS